jgi:hypothetical protein
MADFRCTGATAARLDGFLKHRFKKVLYFCFGCVILGIRKAPTPKVDASD